MDMTGYMCVNTAMTLKAYITKRDGDPKAKHQTKNFLNTAQRRSGAPGRRLRFRQVRVFITLPPLGTAGLRFQVALDCIRTNYQASGVTKRTLMDTIITYLEEASRRFHKGSRVSPFPGLPRKTPCASEGR